MRRALLVAALGFSSVTGCGPPPPPQTSVMQMPPAVIEAQKPVPQRTPTKEIAIRFPYAANEEVTTLAYSDLTLLAKPEVAEALASNLAAWAKDVAGIDRACVDAIVGGAKELLVGGGTRGWVAVIRIPDHKLETVCTSTARTALDKPLEGTTKAWSFKEEGRACATTPGWLACGHPELVKLALAATGDGLVPVGLEGDEVVTIDDRDSSKDLRFVASSTPERLTARLELMFDSDDEARKVHELLARPSEVAPSIATELKATAEQKVLIDHIAKNLVASHRAARASIRVELFEPLATQAKDIGGFSGLITGVLRGAKTQARTEEARLGLVKISEKLTQAWDAKDAKSPFAGQTKLVSLPAVPKTIPKGERVASPADSWKTWSPIAWSLESPSYYQFEVIAAKDGQSADLIARGDVDGNGKASTFTRHVRVEKTTKQLVLEDIKATDPEE